MKNLHRLILACVITTLPVIAQAQSATPFSNTTQGPSLDFTVKYYNRVLSPEGVLRESHYEENTVRRAGHVWTYRVLPKQAIVAPDHEEHLHSHFNHAVIPRHITFNGKQTAIYFVDANEKYVVTIEPTEYGNVGFDGSWLNAYFLVDPNFIERLPKSNRKSPLASAEWHEQEKDGVFQRILWDTKRMIPLIAETGDNKQTFYNRVDVQVKNNLAPTLPWTGQKGYAQKVYADFLD